MNHAHRQGGAACSWIAATNDAGALARIGAAWVARLDEIARADPKAADELEFAMIEHLAARRTVPR